MKTILFGAGSDLGVHVNGASAGPEILLRSLDDHNSCLLTQDLSVRKSLDPSDRSKNLQELNRFNASLYRRICGDAGPDAFPVLIGGDHAAAIPSALASRHSRNRIGIIWIDAHTDFHTFDSTITGNLHGLPLAAITGYHCEALRAFHIGPAIDPHHAAVVGARSVDVPEWINLADAGVSVFTTEDILQKGADAILREAFCIAGSGTDGIHVSYDLDVIDPVLAPGVSVPEKNGIDDVTAMQIMDAICERIRDVRSFDLVEFNPLRDRDRRTEILALDLLSRLLNAVKNI